jgi:uncharacterized membrane protein YdjX (TVP38/TMEM64 family)
MIDPLMEWLRSFGALSPAAIAVMGLMFVTAAFVFVPRTFLSLGVGGLYGMQVLPVVLVSATAGSILAFLVARYLFAERVRRFVERRPRLNAIAEAVDNEGFKLLALLRFASPVPSSVQNYVFAVTRIGLWPFTVATFLFTIPQTVLYVYLGAVGRAVLLDDTASPLSLGLMAVGAASLAVVVFVIWSRARAALARMEAQASCTIS